ncbi:hypothetical protein [Methanopyrus sp.]
MRSLKRFATLGYVAVGRRDFATVLPTVWSIVKANADWLASVPTALASAAFSLVRISTDLSIPYPREALSWIASVACCCPKLCAFQSGIVERMAVETATPVSRTAPMTRPVLRPTVHVTTAVHMTPVISKVVAIVSRVAMATGTGVSPKSLGHTGVGVSLEGVADKVAGTGKGVGSTVAMSGRVLTREYQATPTSYFPRWLLALTLLVSFFLAVWWARRYEPDPMGW